MAEWMIYGANGYTGALLAREAVTRGHRPVLAGRSAEVIEPLARELGCEARVFDLARLDLAGMRLVLHCAGPFVHTSAPMVAACLDSRVHYLDITGEISVFESVFARSEDARNRGITLLPGVGFDVVPTDCLAAMLHESLPDAVELWLAFWPRGGGVSRGTARTMIEGAPDGGAIRREGRLVRVPMLWDVREIPFERSPRTAATIPWGDVATAYRTTGIPNIRVYTTQSPAAIRRMRRMLPLLPLLRFKPLRRLVQAFAARRTGPSVAEREGSGVELWGRVVDRAGREVTRTMRVAEGYTFTVRSSLAAVERMLDSPPPPGATTPALAFGPSFVTGIEGTEVRDPSPATG